MRKGRKEGRGGKEGNSKKKKPWVITEDFFHRDNYFFCFKTIKINLKIKIEKKNKFMQKKK